MVTFMYVSRGHNGRADVDRKEPSPATVIARRQPIYDQISPHS